MPMFYFNIRGRDTITDIDGTDLPDHDAARAHGEHVARELMQNSDGILDQRWASWTMVVCDADGEEVHRIAFSEL